MVMGNFERGSHDAEMSDAIDFVVDCVSKSMLISLSQYIYINLGLL